MQLLNTCVELKEYFWYFVICVFKLRGQVEYRLDGS